MGIPLFQHWYVPFVVLLDRRGGPTPVAPGGTRPADPERRGSAGRFRTTGRPRGSLERSSGGDWGCRSRRRTPTLPTRNGGLRERVTPSRQRLGAATLLRLRRWG